MKYKVKLDKFEGPLDLLLHLIKDNEINVYDIPIVLITEQYMSYIDVMKTLNLDIAGDFLVMAAELTRIKSKLLLPTIELESDEDNDEIDPREELVQRLLEYKKFKDAADRLKEKSSYQENIFPRINIEQEAKKEDELITELSLFDLINAFQNIMQTLSFKAEYELTFDEMSVGDRLNQIKEILAMSTSITFNSLFNSSVSKMLIIVTFLALLELIKQKIATVYQAKGFGAIRIMAKENKKI